MALCNKAVGMRVAPAGRVAAPVVCPGAFTAAPVRAARASRASLLVSNSYKNKENIQLDSLPQFQQHADDSGSSQVQVARLTARIVQISKHIATNRKDHAARRGLEAILSQRKSLLQYLYRADRSQYDRLVKEFSIRSVVASDTRGAARKSNDTPLAAASSS